MSVRCRRFLSVIKVSHTVKRWAGTSSFDRRAKSPKGPREVASARTKVTVPNVPGFANVRNMRRALAETMGEFFVFRSLRSTQNLLGPVTLGWAEPDELPLERRSQTLNSSSLRSDSSAFPIMLYQRSRVKQKLSRYRIVFP